MRAELEQQRVPLLLAERMILVLVFELRIDVANLAVDGVDLTAEPVHVAALLIGDLQPVLIEIAAHAGIEAAAALADLIGAIRNAEALESLFTAVQPRATVRHHVHFRAGSRVLDQAFLGLAIRPIADADVFPIGVEALALGETGATVETRENRECRKDFDERPVFHGSNSKSAGLNHT